jgi:hypothetical protein
MRLNRSKIALGPRLRLAVRINARVSSRVNTRGSCRSGPKTRRIPDNGEREIKLSRSQLARNRRTADARRLHVAGEYPSFLSAINQDSISFGVMLAKSILRPTQARKEARSDLYASCVRRLRVPAAAHDATNRVVALLRRISDTSMSSVSVTLFLI